MTFDLTPLLPKKNANCGKFTIDPILTYEHHNQRFFSKKFLKAKYLREK
jgi:hypothetical protein